MGDAGAADPRHFRQGRADLLHPFLRRQHGGQVRVVEVAVIRHGLLGTPLGGGAVCLLVVTGFLDDLHVVDEAGGLALHLETHGLLHGLQRINVLRLGAGAVLGGALGHERQVGVHAHGPLVHAGIGHA